MALQKFTLAGGCFWCLDAIYRQVRGVKKVVSGYAGGITVDPTYDEVCGGKTGHAECIQITFDPEKIPENAVLDLFFTLHDPTTPNRQGNDVGPQYRSAMYYHGELQKILFEDAKLRAEKIWDNSIVTEIQPLTIFYPAEEYHQDYFHKNPGNGYCNIVITPKIIKVRQKFQKWMLPL